MDLGDFAAKIAEARAMMDTLGKDIETTFKVRSSGITATANRIAALRAQMAGLNAEVKVSADGLAAVAAKTAAAAAAGGAAGRGGGRVGFGWWGGLTPNALHWIIAGGAEILAVTVPAMVALGAAAAVAVQGAQMVDQHMEAVYTATEATSKMFGVTAGMAVGLGHGLQAAQDAANPNVYSVLGSAVITVNEHFGNLAQTGLEVTRMFQTFAAKVAVDFGPGGAMGSTVSDLLSHMTSDLQGLGQVLGNTGHALLNWADAMPGLAEFLLKFLSGVTGLAAHLTGAAGPLITVGMGFEELYRWGGLAAGILARVGLGVGKLLSGVGLKEAGGAIGALSKALQDLTKTGMGKLQIAGVAALAIGIGFLIDKFVTAQTAAQKFTSSLQQEVLSGSNFNAFSTIIDNIVDLNAKLHSTPDLIKNASRSFQGGNPNIRTFNDGLKQQQQDLINVSRGAQYLATTYKTSLVGALALADLANVKLASGITGTGQQAAIARMQVASLVQGYRSMGQPLGAVGSDMTALAIQSGLAATKVSGLNQAWDQFQQNLTGGTAGLGGFVESIANMGSKVATGAKNLDSASKISLGVQQFAQSLTSFAGSGAQAWQNFDQVVGSTAPQLIDWLRTAGAEGAIQGPQFTKAVMGMVSSLTGFASKSPTAQAELLGLVQQVEPNITTWGQLTQVLKSSHANLNDTSTAIQDATAKMGDMSQIAQNLGNVLQSALLTALSTAKIAASGAGAAMQTYEQDIMNAGTSAAKTAGDRAALIRDLEKLGYSAKQAAQLIQMVADNMAGLHSKTITITTQLQTVGSPGISTGIPVGVRARGYASGTSGAASGWAWVGEAGPELVKFRGGETVVPNRVARGYAGGTGDADHHVHVYLDSREIYSGVQKQAVTTQRRTGHNGLSKRTR